MTRVRFGSHSYFNTSNVTIQQVRQHSRTKEYIHFNTSNVTIQHPCSCNYYLYFRISIHLMLLFNKNKADYRPCWMSISIHLMLLFNHWFLLHQLHQCHFNTSNVTIQQKQWVMMIGDYLYFNTSNVTIQRLA